MRHDRFKRLAAGSLALCIATLALLIISFFIGAGVEFVRRDSFTAVSPSWGFSITAESGVLAIVQSTFASIPPERDRGPRGMHLVHWTAAHDQLRFFCGSSAWDGSSWNVRLGRLNTGPGGARLLGVGIPCWPLVPILLISPAAWLIRNRRVLRRAWLIHKRRLLLSAIHPNCAH